MPASLITSSAAYDPYDTTPVLLKGCVPVRRNVIADPRKPSGTSAGKEKVDAMSYMIPPQILSSSQIKFALSLAKDVLSQALREILYTDAFTSRKQRVYESVQAVLKGKSIVALEFLRDVAKDIVAEYLAVTLKEDAKADDWICSWEVLNNGVGPASQLFPQLNFKSIVEDSIRLYFMSSTGSLLSLSDLPTRSQVLLHFFIDTLHQYRGCDSEPLARRLRTGISSLARLIRFAHIDSTSYRDLLRISCREFYKKRADQFMLESNAVCPVQYLMEIVMPSVFVEASLYFHNIVPDQAMVTECIQTLFEPQHSVFCPSFIAQLYRYKTSTPDAVLRRVQQSFKVGMAYLGLPYSKTFKKTGVNEVFQRIVGVWSILLDTEANVPSSDAESVDRKWLLRTEHKLLRAGQQARQKILQKDSIPIHVSALYVLVKCLQLFPQVEQDVEKTSSLDTPPKPDLIPPHPMSLLESIWKDYLEEKLNSLASSRTSLNCYIQALLQFFRYQHGLVLGVAFCKAPNAPSLANAFRDILERSLNPYLSRVSHGLAVAADAKLRFGRSKHYDPNSVLEKEDPVLEILKCLKSKEIFESYHLLFLAQRLLLGILEETTQDCFVFKAIADERAVLTFLLPELGSNFCQKAELMLRDVECSEETSYEFKKIKRKVQRSTQVYVASVHNVLWPRMGPNWEKLPSGLSAIASEYTKFYSKKWSHESRTLEWNHCLSTAVIRFLLPPKRGKAKAANEHRYIQLTGSLHQALVLDAIQDNSLSLEQVFQAITHSKFRSTENDSHDMECDDVPKNTDKSSALPAVNNGCGPLYASFMLGLDSASMIRDYVQDVIQSLIEAEILSVVPCHGSTRTEIFCVNLDYVPPGRQKGNILRLPTTRGSAPLLFRETTEEFELGDVAPSPKTFESVYSVDAAIVRTIKPLGSLSKSELTERVQTNLPLTTTAVIDARLESLVDREFLTVENSNEYKYVP